MFIPKQLGGKNKTNLKERKIEVGMIKKRKLELQNLKNSNTFIPLSSLGKNTNKIYDIHDNGGRPFRVIVNNTGITVYKQSLIDNNDDVYNLDEEIYEDIILKLNHFLGYWSGFDSSYYKMHGNSILIQLDTNKYLYIGDTIYAFMTNEKIIDYVSPVGNNDVPYPIAYGNKYVYFMLDQKKMKISDLETPVSVANAEDLYSQFYGFTGSNLGYFRKYNFDNVVLIQSRLY